MNPKKICFITCVNDDELYSECLKYINNLNIPEGFEIENLVIKNADSITSGYNEAMKASDAKYKVYLHQDVFIINRNFIFDILNIFNCEENIGLLGTVGAKNIPTNAKWWEALHRIGGVYENHTGQMKLLKLDNIEDSYEDVKALDGFLLVTQEDIPWREDIFTGWHFYDMSQCVEFSLKGYKVVVPKQEEPWCIHDCGFVETTGNYDKYREIFLEEYSKKLFPLVSVLIPTYNRPDYFRIALESAIKQTYKNIEIIIGDDSTNEETKNLIKPYIMRHDNIKYINNNGPLGEYGHNNIENIFKLSKGKYINILMDDDVFALNKIEVMVNYFIQYNNISLVTSFRQVIDEQGNSLQNIYSTTPLCNETKIFKGSDIGKMLLETDLNLIGEPTTALVSRKSINTMFGNYMGKQYKVMVDVAQWLESCKLGDVVYISQPLSYFRSHGGQNQRKPDIIAGCYIDKYNYITDSLKNNIFITYKEGKGKILPNLYKKIDKFLKDLISNRNVKVNEEKVEKLKQILKYNF